MNLSKEQIETLIKIGEIGDNHLHKNQLSLAGDRSLQLRLIEGKVLIDRWNNITTKIMFNTQHQDRIHKELSKNTNYDWGKNWRIDGSSIWGADIIYSDAVPSDKILMFSNEDRFTELLDPVMDEGDDDFDSQIDKGRAIAVIPMVDLP